MLESYSDVLTVQDVMTILHIGRSKAYELLRTNEIPSMKIGKKYIVPKHLLIDFLSNNKVNN
ncbi:helix-turn-helix domain-containing protein [uncultured Ruminococcus sp.]|uniref:helix-turn-helix domain-containing protein n=1 Tax=uncultured Ruminococcus sp. TaxID=165186 RepID=UPI0025EBBF83|nr:helix-turn-helix domain-containing protein [uncultured Ruminococcus sp.]